MYQFQCRYTGIEFNLLFIKMEAHTHKVLVLQLLKAKQIIKSSVFPFIHISLILTS